MVESRMTRLQSMLQEAVQSVRWTYSIFWQLCPQQGILVWGDGFYNGAIKTRKTIQPTEVTTEEATLHRSQQLRELYESLSTGETSHHARWPSAALSPEDLTESEWFYLMCVSFTFPPGVGLPGKAYVKKQHIWLTRANEVDNKVFSRALLAKSARIQTVVCIPLLDGVVELGTAERVEEDIALIQRVKTFFYHGGQIPTNLPRPVLSEQSTSNPPNYTEPRLNSHAVVPICAPTFPPMDNRHLGDELGDGEEGIGSDSDPNQNTPTLPMQLDNGPTNLNSNFDFFTASRMPEDHRRGGFTRASSTEMWPPNDPMRGSRLQPPQNSGFGFPTCEDLEQDNTHYPQTVSTILESQSARWTKYSSSSTMSSAATSAFSNWSSSSSSHSCDIFDVLAGGGTSQWALKYILFNVPLLHTKSSDPTAAQRPGTPPDELNASHILAERRRREKLNERFIVLRSLVPFVTKMDKASILGDTIEYLKHMRKKIEELEAEKVSTTNVRNTSNLKEQMRGWTTSGREKMRKMRKEGGGEVVESRPGAGEGKVEVSIIGSDALVEIQCVQKEGLLLNVMQVLGELGIEVATVQSSISNGVFAAEFRAKVKKNANGTKANIMEVKRSINQRILYC